MTGGEDANCFAWSCPPLPREENEMTIDGGSSILAKRDHEGDIEMGNLSPANVRRPLSHLITLLWADLPGGQKRFRYL